MKTPTSFIFNSFDARVDAAKENFIEYSIFIVEKNKLGTYPGFDKIVYLEGKIFTLGDISRLFSGFDNLIEGVEKSLTEYKAKPATPVDKGVAALRSPPLTPVERQKEAEQKSIERLKGKGK